MRGGAAAVPDGEAPPLAARWNGRGRVVGGTPRVAVASNARTHGFGVINALGADEQPTAEQQGRMTELRSTAAALETRVAAATETEQRALQNAPEHTVDGAERERRELRSRSRLGRWFEAAISGRNVSGAEAEVATAYGCPEAIPLEMFERRASGQTETRAVTPVPSTVDENLAPIVPALFDRSAAAWLGVEMPTVATGDAGYPVLSTSLTGGPKAKSATAAETAGAFTVTMSQPRRITGALRFTREDAARLSGMEEALRMNVESVLSDALDNQAINGSGTGDGTINGLRAILGDAAAPAANAETFARYVAAAASHVDGLHAVDLSGMRQLVGVTTYGHMASAFRANEDSMTAEGWLMDRTGGVRTSRRIPAAASNIQQAIVRRANPAGDRASVMPAWGGIELIRDNITGAGKGEIVITALMLVGDVILLRSGCFVADSYRLA